ncbi:MAG: hypothetical protein JST32_19285 [Bacteroidetes bacterium]|nr:hypothetical protein [Bacteroidota bacterium]
MKRSYYIMLSLKAPGGYQWGSGTITEHPRLHMDLVEEADGLPVTVKTICCTLDQFTGNCKHLAKEIFRLHTLNELL